MIAVQASASGNLPLTARSPAERRDPGWFARPTELGLEGWYALLVLILATRPFYDLILRSPHWRLITDGSWLVVLVLALLAVLPVAGLRWLNWSMRALPLLWLVLLLALASATWSLQPQRTLHHALGLVAISVVGMTLGYLMSPRLLMRTLFWALTILLLVSVASELLGADLWLGRTPGGDRWHGTTWHPNFLGPIGACAGLYFLVALVCRRLDWRLALPMLVLAAVVTLMTRSATSIVMAVTGFATVASFCLGKRLRLGGDLTTLLVVLGLLGSATLALFYWESTTTLLGKDATATNRTAIWQDAIGILEYRPLSGHGYGVVWGLYGGTYFPEFATTVQASHAHNGYLQVATQLGLPAMASAVLLLLRTLVRSVTAFGRWSSAFALFATSYVVMFALGNMTEARLFERWLWDWDWLLFVILATALAAAEGASSRSKSGQRRPLASHGGQADLGSAPPAPAAGTGGRHHQPFGGAEAVTPVDDAPDGAAGRGADRFRKGQGQRLHRAG